MPARNTVCDALRALYDVMYTTRRELRTAANKFAQVSADWIAATLDHRSEGATLLGFYEHDAHLGDRDRAVIVVRDARATQLHALLMSLEGIETSTLASPSG